MKIFTCKNAVAALCLSAVLLGFPPQSLAQQTGTAGVAAQSSGAADSALQTLQGMSPADRKEMLDEALQELKSMSPEQRSELVAAAKAQVQDMPGGKMAARDGQWDKLLTPEQQKKFADELGGDVENTAPQNKSAASGNNVAALLQQIQNLTPAEQQNLRASLNHATVPSPAAASAASPAAPAQTDPCADYKSVNPAFYANCESRMRPGQ